MATLARIDNEPEGPAKQDAIFNLGPGAHQCWYPVALSSDVPQGKTLGRDLGDGRVVIYRGEDGIARVMSAHCKHMGADLSIGGDVIGNDIRCPYHHWSYGDGGQCTHIPSGDPIPRRAKLFHFPTKEQFGLIWAFFGETPLYELQTFEDFDDNKYVARSYEVKLTETLFCEPWMFLTNVFDIVHLRFLHGVNIVNSEVEEIDIYRRTMSWDVDLGEKASGAWRPEIQAFGMNSLRMTGYQGGRLKNYIAGTAPCGREGLKFFLTIITTNEDGAEAFLDGQAAMHTAIINEDVPVLNNIRYRNFHLVQSDRAISRFIRSVLKYPRTTMEALERGSMRA